MNMDPHRHLAIEESLLDLPGDAPPVMYFWRSWPSVVIGKNQIPWREADLGWMRSQGVRLCRRASGGGAVYHDEGNLNWAVCVSRDRYDARRITDCCLAALSSAGIRARAAGAASLLSEGAKISGIAYAYRKDRVLHHGTMLGDADLGKLRRALQPPAGTWETHAVRSEPMHVRNVGGANTERFQSAFMDGFSKLFSDVAIPDELSLAVRADAHVLRLKSLDWLLGRSPRFRYDFQGGTEAAPVHANVIVEHGRVQAGSILQRGSESWRVPDGEWFGAPCLNAQGVPGPPEFAAFGNPADWGGQ